MKSKSLKKTKSSKNGKRYLQTRLQFGSPKSRLTKCPECEMTYSPTAIEDVTQHNKFHDLHLKGRKWPQNWGTAVYPFTNERTPPPTQQARHEKMVMINPDLIQEVNATLEIMTIVNNELNAPQDENSFWMSKELKGKAFLYIKDDHAVGAITMEVLDKDRGKWMIYESKKIVPNVSPNFVLGISRIWVCKTQRNNGIASKLLETARSNTIYGEVVPKHLVAWSQPTESGGKLASHYNGVKHKSGKLLIPCYM